jgi:hypothetical protein
VKIRFLKNAEFVKVQKVVIFFAGLFLGGCISLWNRDSSISCISGLAFIYAFILDYNLTREFKKRAWSNIKFMFMAGCSFVLPVCISFSVMFFSIDDMKSFWTFVLGSLLVLFGIIVTGKACTKEDIKLNEIC